MGVPPIWTHTHLGPHLQHYRQLYVQSPSISYSVSRPNTCLNPPSPGYVCSGFPSQGYFKETRGKKTRSFRCFNCMNQKAGVASKRQECNQKLGVVLGGNNWKQVQLTFSLFGPAILQLCTPSHELCNSVHLSGYSTSVTENALFENSIFFGFAGVCGFLREFEGIWRATCAEFQVW